MKILVFGDSLVRDLVFGPPCEAHVECRPGATSEQLAVDEFGLEFLLAEDAYDALVISAGTNDPWPVATTLDYLRWICDGVPFDMPVVVVEPPLEPFSLGTDLRRARVVRTDDLDARCHIDDNDGVHLTEAGSAELVQRVVGTLRQIAAPAKAEQ